MIEVRIDTVSLGKVKHDVLHSVYMIEKLQKAGIPIIGPLIARGIERGKMIWTNEDGLNGHEIVIRWFDEGEKKPAKGWKAVDRGFGECYEWTRFADPDAPPPDDDEEL